MALFGQHGVLFRKYRALFRIYRALFKIHRALFGMYRALFGIKCDFARIHRSPSMPSTRVCWCSFLQNIVFLL